MSRMADNTDHAAEHSRIGYWTELGAQFKLAWPTALSMLFHYMLLPISLSFCGHLGKVELASVAMAISVMYVVTVSVGRGLSFGADTFFSQTYGSANKKNVGVYLQKGLIFATLWSLPVVAILLNTENILLLIGQEEQISAIAQQYTQLFSPGVFAYCWLFVCMRYLLCQNKVIPNLVICIISCAVNAILNYGLVYQADMGIKGSAIALMLTYYLVLIQLVSYIWGCGIYKETWDGWTWRCLDDWGEYFSVTGFSFAMTFVLWVCTEVGTFLGGLLSTLQLSAFSVSFQIEGFVWMLPLGMGGACSTRIGQHLGANRPLDAKAATLVALAATTCMSIVVSTTVYFCRFLIPKVFSDDEELIEYTAGIIRVTAIFLVLEFLGGICVGVIRGVGRQAFGTVVMVISYFVFAWPVGIPLMFATSLQLYGLWWGFVLGAGVQTVSFCTFIALLNWGNEAAKAQVRAGVSQSGISDSAQDDTSQQPNERTGLLAGSTYSTNTTDSSEVIVQNGSGTPRFKLILKRLLVVAIYASFLVIGLFTRFFVKINPKWTSLCLPRNESNIVAYDTEFNKNSSLPFCNDYSSLLDISDVFHMF